MLLNAIECYWIHRNVLAEIRGMDFLCASTVPAITIEAVVLVIVAAVPIISTG